MKIAVTHPDETARRHWVRALAARLPEARVADWPAPEAHGADFAVVWKPPAGFFAAHPALRAVFSAGAGVDHLLRHGDVPATLPVVRLEDAGMARQMIDYCLHAVLRIVLRADAYEAQQRDACWRELAPVARTDLTVGVLGIGALGGQVARALAAAGFRVLGHARSPHRIDGVECLHGDAQLPSFLARTHVLILMAPLTDDTRHLIDARRLALLPRHAVLVNVARGAVVDEAALVEALRARRLAGAALDVFATQPLPPEHALFSLDNVLLTPHAAGLTQQSMHRMSVGAAEEVRRLLAGQQPLSLVNREALDGK